MARPGGTFGGDFHIDQRRGAWIGDDDGVRERIADRRDGLVDRLGGPDLGETGEDVDVDVGSGVFGVGVEVGGGVLVGDVVGVETDGRAAHHLLRDCPCAAGTSDG